MELDKVKFAERLQRIRYTAHTLHKLLVAAAIQVPGQDGASAELTVLRAGLLADSRLAKDIAQRDRKEVEVLTKK